MPRASKSRSPSSAASSPRPSAPARRYPARATRASPARCRREPGCEAAGRTSRSWATRGTRPAMSPWLLRRRPRSRFRASPWPRDRTMKAARATGLGRRPGAACAPAWRGPRGPRCASCTAARAAAPLLRRRSRLTSCRCRSPALPGRPPPGSSDLLHLSLKTSPLLWAFARHPAQSVCPTRRRRSSTRRTGRCSRCGSERTGGMEELRWKCSVTTQ
mmetsp:Transcript_80923/g.227990  ORF Transcript_80923/g.227990 Transcript_80923/m.227990 type:complete len:217 (+) Transcript_80923:314-964(+)